MTVLCGGGASSIKTGTAQQVVFSAALITAGLADISPYLLPFAGYIDSFIYQATTQCSGDPPPMPSLSQLNPINAVGGIFNPNLQSWLTAVNNLLLNWAWSLYCQCNVNPQPTFVFPPPATNVSVPGPTAATPCSTGVWSGTPPDRTNNQSIILEDSTLNWPGVPDVMVGSSAGTNYTRWNAPYPTSVNCQLSITTTTSVVNRVNLSIVWVDSTKQFISSTGLVLNASAPGTYSTSGTFVVPAGAQGAEFAVYESQLSAYDANTTAKADTQFMCGAPTIGNPCGGCPPDANTQQLLQQILQVVNSIFQSTPAQLTSYAESTVHANLSGAGSINLGAQTIGIKVTITTDNPVGTSDPGNPAYLFNRGYIVPLAVEGPIRGNVRLVYNPQLYQLPVLTDAIGYTFPAGQVVKITELTRGP